MVTTEADFERVSWHDCHLWGFEIQAGDAESDDWTSDLVLHIDFIVEWLCAVADGPPTFRVAPAILIFHGVTNPRIRVESENAGFQVGLAPFSIDVIRRETIRDQRVYLDRPYFRWTVELNAPRGGVLEFGAYGFTQRLLTEPILTYNQHLTRSQRRGLLSRSASSPSPEG